MRNPKNLYYKQTPSPVGLLKLVATDDALVAVLWEREKSGRVKLERMDFSRSHPILLRAEHQLKEYFKGTRKSFDLPLMVRGTSFQTRVWKALGRIPFGQVKSYKELARTVGSPRASRAVGSANGRNPLSIVVPCHRVISASGRLAGFAGGLKSKEILLRLEGYLDES